jgi:hypothetical protein
MTSPLVILASPLFPNVPDLPGIPPVARHAMMLAIAAAPLLIPGLLGPSQTQQMWGIIDSSYKYVIKAESFVSMEYDHAMNVSSFPVEKGTFSTFNKVHVPFSGTVSLAQGGNDFARQAFIEQIKSVMKDSKEYYLAVPEGSYGPLTLDRVSYERTAQNGGASRIIAHIHFTQIRILPPTKYAHSATPGGAISTASLKSAVPTSAITNPTTSMGTIDPTHVSSATSYAESHAGNVSAGSASSSMVSNYLAAPAA